MGKKYFVLESISLNKLERLKWIVEEFLTADLEALPYLKRQSFIGEFFHFIYNCELKELEEKDAAEYEQYLSKRKEGKQ